MSIPHFLDHEIFSWGDSSHHLDPGESIPAAMYVGLVTNGDWDGEKIDIHHYRLKTPPDPKDGSWVEFYVNTHSDAAFYFDSVLDNFGRTLMPPTSKFYFFFDHDPEDGTGHQYFGGPMWFGDCFFAIGHYSADGYGRGTWFARLDQYPWSEYGGYRAMYAMSPGPNRSTGDPYSYQVQHASVINPAPIDKTYGSATLAVVKQASYQVNSPIRKSLAENPIFWPVEIGAHYGSSDTLVRRFYGRVPNAVLVDSTLWPLELYSYIPVPVDTGVLKDFERAGRRSSENTSIAFKCG